MTKKPDIDTLAKELATLKKRVDEMEAQEGVLIEGVTEVVFTRVKQSFPSWLEAASQQRGKDLRQLKKPYILVTTADLPELKRRSERNLKIGRFTCWINATVTLTACAGFTFGLWLESPFLMLSFGAFAGAVFLIELMVDRIVENRDRRLHPQLPAGTSLRLLEDAADGNDDTQYNPNHQQQATNSVEQEAKP